MSQGVGTTTWARDVALGLLAQCSWPPPPPRGHVTVTFITGCREQCRALIDSAVSFLNLVSLNGYFSWLLLMRIYH